MFLDALDQTFLEFGIVHRQHRLSAVQIDLNVRAFAGFEDRSLLREPAPELFARHVFNYKQYCLYRQAQVTWLARRRTLGRIMKCPRTRGIHGNALRGRRWYMLLGSRRLRHAFRFAERVSPLRMTVVMRAIRYGRVRRAGLLLIFRLAVVGDTVGMAGVVAALSVVSDLTRGHPPGEAMRACLLAGELARRAGLDERGRQS